MEMGSHGGKSLAAFLEELKKCVLLCANCHGEVEAGVIPSPPPGAIYGEDWTVVPLSPIIESSADTEPPRLASEQLTLGEGLAVREAFAAPRCCGAW
jgi:hypothetical protein